LTTINAEAADFAEIVGSACSAFHVVTAFLKAI